MQYLYCYLVFFHLKYFEAGLKICPAFKGTIKKEIGTSLFLYVVWSTLCSPSRGHCTFLTATYMCCVCHHKVCNRYRQ